MRRKIKIDITPQQPTLFDFVSDGQSADVHPSIKDFVVKVKMKGDLRKEVDADDTEIEPMAESMAAEQVLFLSFGSGSSGNCAYIGTRRQGILIDAGIDPRKVEAAMLQNGLSMSCVKGVCLTHDHSDHVRYVYQIVRLRRDVGVYCTPKVLSGLLRRHSISRRIKDYHRPIYKEFPFELAGLTITPFDVRHDGTDNVGFYLVRGEHTFAVATDLGSITDRVDYYMRKARYVIIESNYDEDMLRRGPYSAFLKSRIMAANGHLDNKDTARFVTALAAEGNLEYVFLCHLSRENNLPEIAVDQVKSAIEAAGYGPVGDCSASLETEGAPIQLMALPRFEASPLMVFRGKKAVD